MSPQHRASLQRQDWQGLQELGPEPGLSVPTAGGFPTEIRGDLLSDFEVTLQQPFLRERWGQRPGEGSHTRPLGLQGGHTGGRQPVPSPQPTPVLWPRPLRPSSSPHV